jgi:response regulator RpfG family c-di-GMP phosphodiesterase
VAEAMGISSAMIRILNKESSLHDVCKIGIADNILLKPDKLIREEFEDIKQADDHGADIVQRSDWFQGTVEVVGSHHEKCDGTGYTNLSSSRGMPHSLGL